MRHTLEGLGFDVEEASADGLTRCRLKMPDVILLDWHIPGSNAIEFIAAARSLPGGKQTKILYVATNNDPIEIGRAIASGANDYIIKPFRRVTLEAKVATLTTKPRAPTEVADFSVRTRKAASPS